MSKYTAMEKSALNAEYASLKDSFEAYKAQGLKLNMARGKPGSEQLNISNDMLTVLTPDTDFTSDDLDEAIKVYSSRKINIGK